MARFVRPLRGRGERGTSRGPAPGVSPPANQIDPLRGSPQVEWRRQDFLPFWGGRGLGSGTLGGQEGRVVVAEKDFRGQVRLGQTDLVVGRLGISSGYGLGAEGLRLAYDRGQNFLHFSHRASEGFWKSAADLAAGDRGGVVLAVHSYARLGSLLRRRVERALARLGTDHLDLLILGYHQGKAPSRRVMRAAQEMRQAGLIRYLGMSSHDRPLLREVAQTNAYDVLMTRYNAAHRGAEGDIYEHLPDENGPGILAFTATRWGHLLDPRKMPPGEVPLTTSDCYRFALTHPRVDLVLTGSSDAGQMRAALGAIDKGPMLADELARLASVGDYVRGKRGGALYQRF